MIWDDMCKNHPIDADNILSLKSLLTAPDDGFLLVDILTLFLKFRDNLHVGLSEYSELEAHLETADLALNYIKKVYPCNNPSNSHLCYSYFLIDCYAYSGIDPEGLSDGEKARLEESFINGKLWYGYKKRNGPLYSALFFPFVDRKDLDPSFENALRFFSFLKTQIFKILSDSKNVYENKRSFLDPYTLSKALKTCINRHQYQHLNLTYDFHRLNEPKILFEVLTGRSQKSELVSIEDDLTDKNVKKEAQNVKIKHDPHTATRYLRSIFRLPTPEDKVTRRQDRNGMSDYCDVVGLVWLENSALPKKDFGYASLEPDPDLTEGNLKSIRMLSKKQYKKEVQNDYSDDLDDEVVQTYALWPEFKYCETNNPSVKITQIQRVSSHIAFFQQHLKPRLPRSEIKKILSCIKTVVDDCSQGKRSNHVDGDRRSILSILLSLLFGRNFTLVRLSNYIKPTGMGFVYLDNNAKLITVLFPHYEHRRYEIDERLYEPALVDRITLKLPNSVSLSIHNLTQSLKDQFGEDNKSISLPDIKELNIFLEKNGITAELKDLLSATQRSYSDITEGDSWLMSLFTANLTGLQSTQKHYASLSMPKVQRIFETHCTQFLNTESAHYRGFNFSPQRIGSPFVVKESVMKEINSMLIDKFMPLVSMSKKNRDYSHLEFAMRFNALAIYVDLYFSFSTATRNVTDPIVKLNEISKEGICRIVDKDIFDGFNTRLVYVPPELKKMLECYFLVRKNMLDSLKKRGLLSVKSEAVAKENLLYFAHYNQAQNKISLQPFTRIPARDAFCSQASHLKNDFSEGEQDLLKLLIQFKTNLNRHYLRGKLLEDGVPGYFIDAYMGHWLSGTAPWSQFTLINQHEFFRVMKQKIPGLQRSLGFKSMDAQ
jgi:hypothetical protein